MSNQISRSEIHEQIVNNISILIRNHLSIAAYQQYNPDPDPDRMDATIADSKEKAARLRKLREEFEDIVTGIL